MSIEVLPALQGIATVAAMVIFLFAAFRAVTIGRALVNRVYRTRAYVTGIFGLLTAVNYAIPSSWVIDGMPVADMSYGLVLLFLFVLLDATILVSLDTDFFHRNTLRWRQVRLVAYPLSVGITAVTSVGGLLIIGGYLPSNYNSTLNGEIILGAGALILGFSLVCSLLTATITARRCSDTTLRRFMQYLGILVFLYLVNTLIWTLITMAVTPFLQILYAYVTYRMVMSLSPVGKVQKAVNATSPQ